VMLQFEIIYIIIIVPCETKKLFHVKQKKHTIDITQIDVIVILVQGH
jgi:hypothetical protein